MQNKIVKRICKCGVAFTSSDILCPKCRTWSDYLKTHRIKPVRRTDENIYFAFSESWFRQQVRELFEINAYATFTVDKHDKKHFVTWIFLYNFNHLTTDDQKISMLVRTFTHESLHELCYITHDFNSEVSKKLDDSGILKRLENEGFLG